MSPDAHAPGGGRLDAVVFDGTPAFVESKKSRAPETRLFGAMIFGDELARALLRYGTADRYVYFNRDFNDALRHRPADQNGSRNGANGKRTWIANPASIETLRPLDRVVLLTFRALPQNYVPLRRHLRKAWPIVCSTSALSSTMTPGLVSEMLTRDLRDYDAIVCPSHAASRTLEKLLTIGASAYAAPDAPHLLQQRSDRLRVIPHGIDCDQARVPRDEARRALDIDEHTIVLLHIGRLTPHAKADLGPLLWCFHELRQQSDQPLLLAIAGDDTRHHMADALRQYARALGCESAVRVLPDVTADMKWRLYAAADIFVSPGDHVQESFGIALAEAMAAGVPVVASDWSGYRDIVDHGETGFLVPTSWMPLDGAMELAGTGNDFESRNTALAGMTIVDDEQLFDTLRALVTNGNLRREMGERARRVARDRFDWSRVIPQYEALFVELLAARPAGGADCWQTHAPYAYDVQDIFSHYPRGVLPLETAVRLTARGRRWLDSRVPLSTLVDFAIDEEAVGDVLGDVAARDTPASAGALVDRLAARGTRISAVWLLSRLFKYGLVRAGDDAPVR